VRVFLMTTGRRFGKPEGAYEQGDGRLSDLHQAIQGFRDDINVRLSEMNSRINTLYMMIGGPWATNIAGFVALLIKLQGPVARVSHPPCRARTRPRSRPDYFRLRRRPETKSTYVLRQKRRLP
jgi:hypothetical protein